MFFLFRCVFWLGIVFYHMPWSDGARPAQDARAALSDLGVSAAKSLADQAQAACVKAPRDCLAAAAKLGADAPSPSRSSLRDDDKRPEWRGAAQKQAQINLRSHPAK